MTDASDRATGPTPTVDHDPPAGVAVVGEDVTVVPIPPPDADGPLPETALETGFSCDTGTSAAGTWRGVPLAALLDHTALPDDTTHLLLRARDGFQVCVPVATALDGVVATTLDGDPIDDARTRFVAPGLDSARCLRDLAVVEAAALPPGADRGEYESIGE